MMLSVEKKEPNPYVPEPARIKKIIDEAEDVKTFIIEPVDMDRRSVFKFKPGQFLIWSVPGIGEAPFSYSSFKGKDGEDMYDNDLVELTIHRIGRVTNALFSMDEGDIISVRGPYGNGFPVQKMEGKNLVFIMGGIGAAPLRGVLHYVLQHRDKYKQVCAMHGARTPQHMLFVKEFEDLIENPEVSCMLTVDKTYPGDPWEHSTGVVTTLFDKYQDSGIDPNETVAMICGPPVMYKFVIEKLLEMKIKQNQIFMTLERRMKCGIGKCGHCAIDYVYTCVEGPVFTYWDAKDMKDLI